MHMERNLDKAEYQIYDMISQRIIKDCPLRAIIYLKCDP